MTMKHSFPFDIEAQIDAATQCYRAGAGLPPLKDMVAPQERCKGIINGDPVSACAATLSPPADSSEAPCAQVRDRDVNGNPPASGKAGGDPSTEGRK